MPLCRGLTPAALLRCAVLPCVLPQDGLCERLQRGGSRGGGDSDGADVPRRVRPAPFVQIPLGVTEDRLVGTVDIEASMKVTHPESLSLLTYFIGLKAWPCTAYFQRQSLHSYASTPT